MTETTPAIKDKQLVIRKLIVGTFDTLTGRKLLDHLRHTLVDKPVYRVGQTLEQTAFNEGRRDVIIQILKELDQWD